MQCDVVDATTWRAFVGRASDLSDDRESGASTRPGLRCQQGVGSDRSVKIELLRLTVAATKKRSVSPKKLSRAIVGGLRLVLDSQTDVSDLDPSDVKHTDARLPFFFTRRLLGVQNSSWPGSLACLPRVVAPSVTTQACLSFLISNRSRITLIDSGHLVDSYEMRMPNTGRGMHSRSGRRGMKSDGV